MSNNTFAERLKIARENQGMTQDNLAKLLGIDRTAVVKWESKTINPAVYPTVNHLKEVVNILEISSDWLLGINTRPKPSVNTKLKEILELPFEAYIEMCWQHVEDKAHEDPVALYIYEKMLQEPHSTEALWARRYWFNKTGVDVF